jgi:hypothetical protein
LPAIGLGQAATSLPGSQDQQSGPMLQPCKQPLITTQETPQGTVGRNGPTVAAGSSHSDQQHLKLRQQKLHFFAAQPSAKNLSKTASAGTGSHADSRVASGRDNMRTSSNAYGGVGRALAMTVSGQAAVSAAEAEPAVTAAAESEYATASAAGSGGGSSVSCRSKPQRWRLGWSEQQCHWWVGSGTSSHVSGCVGASNDSGWVGACTDASGWVRGSTNISGRA